MIKENKNFKFEKEAFLLRCRYEKELHSNKNSLATVGFLFILGVMALAFQNRYINSDLNIDKSMSKNNIPICSQKMKVVCVAKRDGICSHSR